MRRALLVVAALATVLFATGLFTGTAMAAESGSPGTQNACSNWGIRTADYIYRDSDRQEIGAVQLLKRTCTDDSGTYNEYLARGFTYAPYNPLPSGYRLIAGIPGTDRWCDGNVGESMCTTYPPIRGKCFRASAAIQRYNATTGNWDRIGYGTTPTVDC
jgi:hypothetical protein